MSAHSVTKGDQKFCTCCLGKCIFLVPIKDLLLIIAPFRLKALCGRDVHTPASEDAFRKPDSESQRKLVQTGANWCGVRPPIPPTPPHPTPHRLLPDAFWRVLAAAHL